MLWLAAPALAQPGQRDNPLSFDRNIKGLIRKYCYGCHNDQEPNGGVDLKQYNDPRMIARDPLVWRTVLDQVRSEAMPPEGARQPKDDERELIAEFIEMTVSEFDCEAERDPGPPMLRRLNRAEYDNSIRHLTGLDLKLSADFPEDPISFGFRNIAQPLTVSPLHVDQYYTAARRVVDSLLAGAEQGADREQAEAFERVFFVTPEQAGGQRQAARRIIERFARRAFRRDCDTALLEQLITLYDTIRAEDKSHRQAVGHLLSAILVSPRFVMRSELMRDDAEGPFPVDDFDLASRLSFFLWSGPPDDTLLQLARDGRLQDNDQLDEQVSRMLADPRSDALVDHFLAPWLQIDSLPTHRPDDQVFPGFDESLRQSILEEPRRLLRHIVRNDAPLTELVAADYAMLNADLAEHYGIDGVAGDRFEPVVLDDGRRGGLLTTAAVLMAQSDPGRTNVPRRGNFIASAILGTAPPPPPPDVPELEEDEELAATLTLRERFEAHRDNPQCYSCHVKIDPLGFALENYDAIGRWREQGVGKPIDASGELPDGTNFDGPVELKRILLQRRDQLTRVLASQMLIYALGRGPILGDDCVIEDALEAAQASDYRFSSLVRTIVQSYPFRQTRNPEF